MRIRSLSSILVTGGCGFIGSNLIRYFFRTREFSGNIVNYDSLTYAGDPARLLDIEEEFGGSQYHFVKGDVNDEDLLKRTFEEHQIDTVIHLAAESHVDRSISEPLSFIRTNIVGTSVLLETARECWYGRDDVHFHHVSTDEVYGSLGDAGYFTEESRYDPRSPYSASKAGSDHLVSAYIHTYGLPATISNCCNNYGPYQYPEKLIPLMIKNMHTGKMLPVYGDGRNIRDWIHVDDHNDGIWRILHYAKAGNVFNLGGGNELRNIELVQLVCDEYADITGRKQEDIRGLISFVKDRPGHDRRYAIDSSKARRYLGWNHTVHLKEGLKATIEWYLSHPEWMLNTERQAI